MKKQLPPALVAGALVLVVVLIGAFLFRAAQPAPTPHPDPARFLKHTAAPPAVSSAATVPGGH